MPSQSTTLLAGLLVVLLACEGAAETDAGVTDAGVTDAGATDAGVTDAGVTDDGSNADALVEPAGCVVTAETTAAGVIVKRTVWSYDDEGNALVGEHGLDGSVSTETYSYGDDGNVSMVESVSDRRPGEDPIRYSFTYGEDGRLLAIDATGSAPRTMAYAYDEDGNLRSRTGILLGPEGFTHDDQGNRLSCRAGGGFPGELIYTYTYGGEGEKLDEVVELSSDEIEILTRRTTFGYDGTGNVITADVAASSDWRWLGDARITWTYDAGGNVLTRELDLTDGVDERTTWTYVCSSPPIRPLRAPANPYNDVCLVGAAFQGEPFTHDHGGPPHG